VETLYDAAVVIKDTNPYIMAGLWITGLTIAGYSWLGGESSKAYSEKTEKILERSTAGFAIILLVSSAIYPLCHFLVK